jgi:hypothetical protein
LKFSFGLGVVLVALITIVLALLGVLSLLGLLSAFLLMFGLWCVVSGIFLVRQNDKYYYVGSGIVVASLSTIYFISLAYSLAVALILAIIIIVVSRIKPKL